MVEAKDGLPVIRVDESRMMQVLGNLVTNALRYTPEKGRIILGAVTSHKEVLIRVQDNGVGIPADELPHIFDRFHRGDKSRHSENGESGLGAAIVKAWWNPTAAGFGWNPPLCGNLHFADVSGCITTDNNHSGKFSAAVYYLESCYRILYLLNKCTGFWLPPENSIQF